MITSDIILISACIVLVYFNLANSHLEITDIKGPSSIESGSAQEVILDCDYVIENEKGVVVKWFYNGQVDQIYQWMIGSDRSYRMGTLKEFIDPKFRISDDPSTMYRAIRLINVTHELSGSYTCKIGGYGDEKFRTKNLTIFVPPSEGLQLTVDEEDLTALCSVSGVYPEPKVLLQILQSNSSNEIIEDEKGDTTIDEETSYYNKTTVLYFSNETLSKPGKFICEMTIPGTSYALTESKSISVDNSSNQPNPSAFILHTSILLLFSFILKY